MAGKRRIVAVDSYNPEKLAEQNAEAKDAAKKAAKKSKRAPTKGTTAQTKTTAKRSVCACSPAAAHRAEVGWARHWGTASLGRKLPKEKSLL